MTEGRSRRARLLSYMLGAALLACAGIAGAQSYLVNPGTSFEDFESVSPWHASGSTLSLDTTHVKSGAAALQVAALPGMNGFAYRQIPSTDMSAMKTVSLWVYMNVPVGSTTSHHASLYFSSDGFATDFLAFTNQLHAGWNKITFAKSDFQAEGAASWAQPMTWMEIGVYGNTSTSLVATFDGMKLNEYTRPKVIFSFDDGRDTTYTQAMPYLDRYGFKGVSFVISGKIDSNNSLYMTSSQLQGLYADGWDLCNHTATHPDLSTLTQSQVASEISTCEQYLTSKGFTRNQGYMHVAYPDGGFSDAVLAAEQQLGILTGRTTLLQTQANVLDSPYLLYDTIVDNTWTRAKAMAAVDQVVARGGLLQLTFHHLVSGTPTDLIDWNLADFQAVVDYVASKKQAGMLDVVTQTQWYLGLNQGAPPVGANISLSQASVQGGSSVNGTLTLDSAVLQNSLVSLRSNSAAASVPASVTVVAGATTTGFTVSTSPVSADTNVKLTATLNGISRNAGLLVKAALRLTMPTSIRAGWSGTGTVTLGSVALGNTVVTLHSSSEGLHVPSQVTVQSGRTSASFGFTTKQRFRWTTVTVTASFGGQSTSAKVALSG